MPECNTCRLFFDSFRTIPGAGKKIVIGLPGERWKTHVNPWFCHSKDLATKVFSVCAAKGIQNFNFVTPLDDDTAVAAM